MAGATLLSAEFLPSFFIYYILLEKDFSAILQERQHFTDKKFYPVHIFETFFPLRIVLAGREENVSLSELFTLVM